MSEATKEAYIYFDTKIRPLPKDENGQIDATASGLVDNDVDAFRHAYVSGVFTQEYNEQTANILGWLNEGTSILSPFGSTNMDLSNNSVGRKLGSIQAGHYQGYGIRNVRGVDYPFSKRDSDPLNNLG